MNELVKLTRTRDVAVVTVDNPPVNAVSPGVPEGIAAALNAANQDQEIRSIVIIGAGQTFIAGADIREFPKMISGERPVLQLLPFLLGIEDSAKPVVMAIHGTALGGGNEIAMAGHYRVLAPTAKVGQPEVNLGLIPGMAGTQRLPRLAGVGPALQLCAFGEPITAQEALALELADRIIEGDLLTGAVSFAREIAGQPMRKARELSHKLLDADEHLFADATEQVHKRRRGQTAPLAAIEAVKAAARLSFDEGCQREQELFRDCLYSRQAKALIHVFFSERAVTKIPGLRRDASYPLHRAAVIGAGTMGRGIALTFANSGIPVIIGDASLPALDRAMTSIQDTYSSSVRRGRLSSREMEARLNLISPDPALKALGDADIIVEAVFESIALKKEVFADLDKRAKPSCILATNTSTLDIDEIASTTTRPEMVIGTHFFSPANIMRLLEIIRGKRTSETIIATALDLAKRLKKIPVLARNGFGFIGNRMVIPYVREAQFLVEEGASVEQVNQAMYEFGMAMGPLAMDDLAGLDVMHLIRLQTQLEPAGARRPLMAEELYRMGRLGQKTGAGWSRYDENRRAAPDPEIANVAENIRRSTGIRKREISDSEIVERCTCALINEGARVLEEGIALRSSDIDIVYLNGYGFPSWRGGPMCYADSVGLDVIIQRIVELGSQHGTALWQPAALLTRLAEDQQTFGDWDKNNSV